MKYSKLIIYCFAFLFVFQSCRKDIDRETETGVVIGPSTNVVGSVFGVVKDAQGEAVENASVRLSTYNTFTDENGVFRFDDIELIQEYEVLFHEISDVFPEENISRKMQGSYLTVEKDGYFLGSRRFYPSLGETSNIEIHLLPEVLVGSFESWVPTTITFDNVEMLFTKNAVIDESGQEHKGVVHVYAKYLDPTEFDVINTMPGDLTGINSVMGLVSLASFGMIAVELEDDQGNPLQIGEDQAIETSFPVPQSLQSNAPSSIPLWSFQETEGIWVHEGEATLENGVYKGSLPHFSFWNCDIPFPAVQLNGNIVNLNGPIVNALIKITEQSSGIVGTGFSNNEGDFSGFVPANELLLLEVFNACGEVVYSEEIGPLTDNINIAIVVDSENYSTYINGSVTSCADDPSDFTYVTSTIDGQTQIIPVDDMNEFAGNLIYCDDDEVISIQAYDPINSVTSLEINMDIVSSIDFGEIELCDTLLQEHYIQQYGNIFRLYTPFDGSLETSIDSFMDSMTGDFSYFLTTLTIDLSTGNTLYQSWPVEEGTTMYETTIQQLNAGFEASGTVTSQIVYQNGGRWAIISGTLTEIEILDPLLYDPSYTEIFFSIAAKI